jgi:two-component system LytT family response regulator
VLVQDVDYITSDGPYAELHVAGRRYVIRETMQTLEERLDPAKFMRVHRSVIVRLELIESLERGAGGDGELHLRGGARLRVSRTRREALERWLGLAR